MNLLAFETATPTGGVALLRQGRVAGHVSLRADRQHSRRCLAMAELLLEAEGLRFGDVDVFACSRGPGSFTGLRIGLTLARALGFSTGKPVVGVDTLEALAVAAADGTGRPVLAALDARKGEVYAGVYAVAVETGRVRVEAILPAAALAPGEVAPWLAGGLARRGAGTVRMLGAGEGVLRYGAELWQASGADVECARADRITASPVATAMLAWTKAGDGVVGGWEEEVLPTYLREAI